MSAPKKVVLAYSGGLDTSIILKWLQTEYGCEVVTFTADLGQGEELEPAREKAIMLGIKPENTYIEDLREEFVRDYVNPMFRANTVYEGQYLLGTSIARPLISKRLVEIAEETGADAVAHGATGKGNDQVRFDLTFQLLAPGLEIITPIRDQQLSREQEVAYLAEHGISWPEKKGKYSINQGVWGTSVGGAETLTSHQNLPEEAWPVPVSASEPKTISLQFEDGEFVGFDGQQFDHPVDAIQALEQVAAPYGIGRDIHVGDTIIGIKGRVGFAAAAPLLILKGHHLLEKHTLGKWQLYWKEQMGNWYGMMVHEGQFLDPVMRDIEAFLASTQARVSGEVHITLHPYRFVLDGISSPYDLLGAGLGQYGEMNNGWTGQDVKGFTKILSLAGQIQAKVAVEEN